MTRILTIAWTAVLVAVALVLAYFSWLNLLYAVCRDVPLPNVEFYSETTK